MVSLSSATVQKHWRYTVDHEFQAVLPGGELVSRHFSAVSSQVARLTKDSQGEAAKWAPGSPHDATSSILNRFIPFPKPIEQWSTWDINADNSMLAVSSSRGIEENTGVILVDLAPDPASTTTTGTANQRPRSQSVFGRLGSYVFGSSSKEEGEPKSKIRSIQGFIGQLSSLVFSPSDPNLLIIGTGPTFRGPGTGAKNTLIFWDVSSNRGNPERLPEDVLNSTANHAIDAMAKELTKAHPGTSKTIRLTQEDRDILQEDILRDLHQIDLTSSTDHFPKVYGRLSTSFDSCPVSSDGTKVLYMPGARPDSNGEDDRWEVAVYDVPSKKTTATLKGHTDSLMSTEFSKSGKWILTVAWDRTVRLWTGEGKEKWVWKTKGQNWVGVFSPDETYVVATCGDGTIFAWSIETGEELWRYRKAENHRWIRSLSFSPDGRYLAFGGEGGGRVSLLDLQAPLTEDKKREVLTYRELGAEGVKRPADDDDDDEDIPEDKRRTPEQKEKHWKQMVKGMIATRSIGFLHQDESGTGAKRTEYRLGYSNSVDRGLEIYDVERNEKWRVQPVTDKRSPKTGTETGDSDEDTTESEVAEQVKGNRKISFHGVYDGLLGWKYLSKTDEVMTIHSDGVRFWNYE